MRISTPQWVLATSPERSCFIFDDDDNDDGCDDVDDDNLTLCLFTSGGGLFVVLKQTALSASVPTPTYI